MVTAISLTKIASPFRAVAQYPPTLPYIGQDDVYHRLRNFTQAISAEEQAHFMALFGAWAIGKSRLAHELIAQFCGQSVGWTLTTGQPAAPLLQPLEQGGEILPLFVPFVDAIRFQSFGLEDEVAIGKITCAAIHLLANEPQARGSHFHILNALCEALRRAHPNFDFSRLDNIATDYARPYAERSEKIMAALGQMTDGQIQRVLVIVDEVESSGEVNVFAEVMEKEVRERPIPPRTVRDLYSGVKEATNTNAYPSLNFLFFNTEAAKHLTHLEALSRRMVTADLEKATATDLERLIEAICQTGYPLTDKLADLARRAFFAADRNIGWFSFIMNKAHQALVEHPDLSIDEVFEAVCRGTGKVFQPGVFEDRDIAPPELKNAMRRIIYNQAPTTLSALGIDPALRLPMLRYEDPFQRHFIGEAAVVAITADKLTRALLETGIYKTEEEPTLTGEGSVRFTPAAVLDSLRTFAWRDSAATDDESDVLLWIYTDAGDFESQVGFAYGGFGKDLSAVTARTIHKLLLERFRVHGNLELVAPTMALLRRFNELWGKAAASNWLLDSTAWEQLLTAIENHPEQNDQRLLQGIANVLFDAPQTVTPSPYPHVRGLSLTLKLESYEQTFNVTSHNQLVLLKARETHSAILEDLHAINRRVPVVLIFAHASRLSAWQQYLRETHNEHVAVAVIAHVVEPQTREWEFYVRYALRDASRDEPGTFKLGEVDRSGQALRDEFGAALREQFKEWLASVEARGYVLRPFFPGRSASLPAFKGFVGAWVELVRAGAISALDPQQADSVRKRLEDYQRDQQNDDVLQLTAGEGQALHALIPPVMPGILRLLQEGPRNLGALGESLFYVRSKRTASYPTNVPSMLEQLLALLQELGVIAIDAQNRYEALTVAAFAARFDLAFQRLGAATGTLSGYVSQVASLSEPVKALAGQLNVNTAQLDVLTMRTLRPQQQRLSTLPLDHLAALPPDEQAYREVAQGIGDVSSALSAVFGSLGATTPPPVDPGTLRANIDEIRSDSNYHLYSIEYRVAFLGQLQQYLDNAEQDLSARLNEARKHAMSLSADFPERPLLALLDGVQADLDSALPGNEPPPSLRQHPHDATLKVLKDAGQLSDVLNKLGWYMRQLDEQNPDGWWARYTAARAQWKTARAAFGQVEAKWQQLETYFAGTAPDHVIRFTGAELGDDMKSLADSVASFVENENAPNVTLDDLASEIAAIAKECASIEERIEAARTGADEEITAQLDASNDAAVRHLAERLRKESILPDRQRALTAPSHQEAHQELDKYRERVQSTGASLCERSELYDLYLKVYGDHQRGMTGEQLYQKYGEAKLHALRDKQLITIRNVVDV